VSKLAFIALGLLFAVAAHAQVDVTEAWVRGTVPGQKATGAFMQIKANSAATLVGATSPVAGTVEIHEMRRDGDVMRMRAVPKIELPAGGTVELKPGGYHVMLMNLKAPLKRGDVVPIKLKLQNKNGKAEALEVKAEVRDLTAATGQKH
jgi:periplasmic copper chaperone A